MSLIKDVENRLEKLFEGFFTRKFKSGVQPIELAKKLAKEMDSHRTISVSKIYVPNSYIVWVSPDDKKHLESFERALVKELQTYLIAHAQKEKYALMGQPEIEVSAKETLSLGQIETEGKLVTPEGTEVESVEEVGGTEIIPPEEVKEIVEALPYEFSEAELILKLRQGEKAFPLEKEVISIGRSEKNDVALADPNISRFHAEVKKKGEDFLVADLGSTNGTLVNGKSIKKKTLQPGDIIQMGETELVFRRKNSV